MTLENVAGVVPEGTEPRTVAGALARLRRLILTRELQPGEQIRQEEMARALGISRVPLREALRVLTTEGLLSHRPNQGYFVAKLSEADLAQILSLLEFLETELIRTAQPATDEEIQQLRGINAELARAAARRDIAAMTRLNTDLHLRMFRLSSLDRFVTEAERFWSLSEPYRFLRAASTDADVTIDQHEQLIDALAAHDRPLALRLLAVHRRDSTSATIRVLEGSELPGAHTLGAPVERVTDFR